MTEKEFEMFCRQKFENPDFLLGRKKKKDTTEAAFDYFADADVNQAAQELDSITDISELLGSNDKPKALRKLMNSVTPEK